MNRGLIKIIENDNIKRFEDYVVGRGYDPYDVDSLKQYLKSLEDDFKEEYGDPAYSYTFKEVSGCGPYLHKTKRFGDNVKQEYIGYKPEEVEEKLK